MEIYLLKSVGCLVVFFAFYKLFLERENMHTFKRFYLLGSILASFGIPFITFTEYIEPTEPLVSILTTESTSIVTQTEVAFNYMPIIWTIYGLGVLFFAWKFGKNLRSMIQKIRKNPHYKNKNLFHVLLQTPTTPHTFFSYIFLNKKNFETNAIPQEVLDHEEVHAKQWHSLDILFIEILQVIFWFNPLFYTIKHSIKLNHEFLADRAVLKSGIDTAVYQKTILAFSSSACSPSLANSINYSFIKKRFTVMKKHTSKNSVWLRSFILLPLIAISIYGFSNKEILEKDIPSLEVEEIDTTKEFEKDIPSLEIEDIETPKEFEKDIPSLEIEDIEATKKAEKEISFKIHKDQIIINNKATSLKNFANTLDAITKGWSRKELANCLLDIQVYQGDKKFMEKLEKEYRKTQLYKVKGNRFVPPPPPPPAPPKATSAPKVIKKGVNDVGPNVPPPPPPVNKVEGTTPVPPPPPTPESPIDHIVTMAKKGATFYHEEEKISSDRAIELLKKHKHLNIQTTGYNSKNPKVRLSKHPYTYEMQRNHNVNLNPQVNTNVNQNLNTNTNLDITLAQESLIDLTDVIKQGATFYYDDKKISTKKAIELTKNTDAIERVQVVKGKDDKPVVYFWSKS